MKMQIEKFNIGTFNRNRRYNPTFDDAQKMEV